MPDLAFQVRFNVYYLKINNIRYMPMLNRLFKLKENNTKVSTEIIAGLTTFMTMAYILALNPNILSNAGMDKTAVLIATCFASFIGTMCISVCGCFRDARYINRSLHQSRYGG